MCFFVFIPRIPKRNESRGSVFVHRMDKTCKYRPQRFQIISRSMPVRRSKPSAVSGRPSELVLLGVIVFLSSFIVSTYPHFYAGAIQASKLVLDLIPVGAVRAFVGEPVRRSELAALVIVACVLVPQGMRWVGRCRMRREAEESTWWERREQERRRGPRERRGGVGRRVCS